MPNRYKFKAKAKSGNAELRIYGNIGQSWWEEESNDAKTIVEKLDKVSGDLDVRINSFGGSVADGLAIHNAIKRHDGTVTTYVDGVAYSIASLIAMAGESIVMAENAMLMIHAPWGVAVGNAPEMRDMADILDKHAKAMRSSYLRQGGPDDATINGWLTDGKDHFFDAEEAYDMGLIDEIGESVDDMPIAAAMRWTQERNFKIAASPRHNPEEKPMAKDDTSTGASTEPPTTPDLMATHSRTVKAAAAKGAKAEAERRQEISAVFEDWYDADPLNPITALHDECMNDLNCQSADAQHKLLRMLAQKSEDPIIAPQHYATERHVQAPQNASSRLGGLPPRMQMSRDYQDKRAEGLQAALSIKAGVETDRKVIDRERKGEFLSMSLVDLMGYELRASGYEISGSREDIARRYTQAMPIMAASPSHGTDHLPAVLGNIANLSAMQGWDASPETWSQWTQAGTLNNYQTATRANVALLDKLMKMLENQEWEYGDLADVKQRITGFFHGLKYALSIQAIVNDDLGELARAMNGWGEAASATVGDAVHAILFTSGSGGFGQSMDEDSTILFHANHSNYVASGSGAAPGETTLNAARAAMRTQSDPNSRKVSPVPAYIIHGPALWSTVRKALSSQDLLDIDVSTSTTISSGSNTVRDMNLTPIEEYRIVASAPAASAWVLAAARRTVEVAGVGGPVVPRAEQSMVSNVPGITYELSMPFGVAALDYRGLYLNYGA